MIITGKNRVVGRSASAVSKFAGMANPNDAHAVADQLLEYLRRRWRLNRLAFCKVPEVIPHGWETYTYQFQLEKCAGLPEGFGRPLILRIYACPLGLFNARREKFIEDYLGPMGFPVAKCLFLEEDTAIFGGPFLVSEMVEGEAFPDYLYHHPWRILDLPRSMGCLHAELHQIPVDYSMLPAEPFLSRHLGTLDRLIHEYNLVELRPGQRWLERHRPEQNTPPAILHLDFHPLNLLYDRSRGFTVLDWSQVDVGDRHADVAVTKMFMDCMQIEPHSLWQRLNYWSGRIFLRRGYRAAYEKHLQLDEGALAYYCAWAAFRRLCTYGVWLKAGPAAQGSKPGSLRHLTRGHIECFCRYFEKHTGVWPSRSDRAQSLLRRLGSSIQ